MRKYALPALIAFVGIAFAVACLLVWLSRGRGPGLRAKLRLGGLMLMMTGVVATGAPRGPEVTCYEPVQPNQVGLIGYAWNKPLVVDLAATNLLHGKITYRSCRDLSWSLSNERSGAVQFTGPCLFGTMEGDSGRAEHFTVRLPAGLAAGTYALRVYTCAVAAQAGDKYPQTFRLTVVNGR